MDTIDYKGINREAWNKKTNIHISSDFYDNESFLSGKSTLKEIELELLGNIEGKDLLHLQCHFGQDSISLSRMGAKVTGVDLSDTAIGKAREFARQTGTDTQFVCSDIYDLPDVLQEKFDIVFTSYGVLGWLPDMKRWAETVSHFLKPGGRLILVEFHPFVWMYDGDIKEITYRYFNTEAIVEDFTGTYADREADIDYKTVCWNHALSEVIGNLLKVGIDIKKFEEYDYSPFNCFANMVETDADRYRIKHLGDKIPMIYAVEGERNSYNW